MKPDADCIEQHTDAVCCSGQTGEDAWLHTRVMFRLVPTMRRGSATSLLQASARYHSLEDARVGATELMREERILKVMIVRNEAPGGYVEWVDR